MLLDFFLQLLSQFAGGPGLMENNLVRFILPAISWGALLSIAWTRQREQELPRERLLVAGFGLGMVSALLMAVFVSLQMMELIDREDTYAFLIPLDRTLAMASIVVIAGAFLRYTLNDERLARLYLSLGLGVSVFCLGIALWQWPATLAALPESEFHTTWEAWLFEVSLSILLIIAIFILQRKVSWLSKVVTLAMVCFLFSEFLAIANYATDKNYNWLICPIGNSLRIAAIPLLGYVYLREQAIDKKRTEKDLEAYRHHLEELVDKETTEIAAVNTRLKHEITERKAAEKALETLNHRYELILNSAGEGICGFDREGRLTFVNQSAANLLGYQAEKLVGQTCHTICLDPAANDSAFSKEDCPIFASFTQGLPTRSDDQVFWKKDRTTFPVHYATNPTYDNGNLTGAVVVFRDITDLKKAQAEISQRNINLAAQNAIANIVSRSLDLDTILDTSLREVLSVVAMDIGLVFLLDLPSQKLILRNSRGTLVQQEAQKPERNWSCCLAISSEAMNEMKAVVHPSTGYPSACPDSNIYQQGLQMLVSVPLVSKNTALGALTLGSRDSSQLQASTLELLTTIGQQIGMAIENAHLYQKAERSARELTLLHQMSIVLTSTLKSEGIYDQVTEQSAKLMDCQMACILKWDAENQTMAVGASYGMSEDQIAWLNSNPCREEGTQPFINPSRSISVDDTRNDSEVSQEWVDQLKARSLLSVPIRGMNEPLGTLVIIDQRGPRHWRHEELELIESFVNRAAVALINANLCKQLEWAAALEERQRIAADMHDGLAQTVSLLGMQTEDVIDLIQKQSSHEAIEELANMRDVISHASKEIRRSIASLQSSPQPRVPFHELLLELIAQIPMSDGPEIELVYNGQEPLDLPFDQRQQVLLVVQEALLNAKRHAHAKHIRLILECSERETRINIVDDGIGFDPSAWWENSQDHFGLGIIHARAARIGAALQIKSAPRQGTQVSLVLPISANYCGRQSSLLQNQAAD